MLIVRKCLLFLSITYLLTISGHSAPAIQKNSNSTTRGGITTTKRTRTTSAPRSARIQASVTKSSTSKSSKSIKSTKNPTKSAKLTASNSSSSGSTTTTTKSAETSLTTVTESYKLENVTLESQNTSSDVSYNVTSDFLDMIEREEGINLGEKGKGSNKEGKFEEPDEKLIPQVPQNERHGNGPGSVASPSEIDNNFCLISGDFSCNSRVEIVCFGFGHIDCNHFSPSKNDLRRPKRERSDEGRGNDTNCILSPSLRCKPHPFKTSCLGHGECKPSENLAAENDHESDSDSSFALVGFIFLAIGIFALVGSASYFYYSNQNKSKVTPTTSSNGKLEVTNGILARREGSRRGEKKQLKRMKTKDEDYDFKKGEEKKEENQNHPSHDDD